MADDAQADGYYAEDDMGNDELDLSFLEDKGDADHADPEAPEQPQK